MADSSSFGKWIDGILGTVLGGVLLWWLTGPQSPFKPKEKKSIEIQKPHVVISQFNLKSPIYTGESTSAEFEVTNEGNATATGCQLIWEAPGLNGARPSDQFNLEPGEKKNFTLTSGSIKGQGTVITSAYLNCGNSNSEKVERPLVVNFMMKPIIPN